MVKARIQIPVGTETFQQLPSAIRDSVGDDGQKEAPYGGNIFLVLACVVSKLSD